MNQVDTKHTKEHSVELNSLLNVEQSSKILNLSERAVRELTLTGKLPVVKIGRSVRIRPADLEAFINESIVKK